MNIPFDPTRFDKIEVLPWPSSSSVGRVEKSQNPPQAPKEPRAGCEQYSQFILFSKLPLEIWARIWYLAVQIPRVVEVHETDLVVFITNRPTPLRSKPRSKTHDVVHFRSKTSDPPLLSACHESRQIALTNIGLKEDRPCERILP
jgi:hypothetical protein